MTPLLLYFIKVNLALIVLYILYKLLFQQDTFFRLRRFTLLVIVGIAFLYPLPDMQKWISGQPALSEYVKKYSAYLVSSDKTGVTEITDNKSNEIGTTYLNKDVSEGKKADSKNWLFVFYITGIAFLLYRSAREIFSVIRLHKHSRVDYRGEIKIYIHPHTYFPFSFFKWIFVNPDNMTEEAVREILIHENTHAKQYHSVDIIIGQLITTLCWINPFAWLIKREISINHEYIADHEVMCAGFNKKTYQYHLIGIGNTPLAAANLYNYFNVLPLKKRITMLNKKRTNQVRIIKYLALIPMVAALLVLNNMDVMARVISLNPPVLAEPITEDLPFDTFMDEDPVYTTVDYMPKYPGGDAELLKYINRTIKYPENAQKEGIKGIVVVSYIVEKDGSLSDFKVVRSVSPELDEESIRVLKTMEKWTPGKHNGEIVRVKYTVPITFRLE